MPVRPVACSLVLALVFAGCRKEPGGPSWDVDLLAPVLHASMTIGDLVGDSLVATDPDGQVSLLYVSELFAVDKAELLEAPDTVFAYPWALPVPGPVQIPAGVGLLNSDEVHQFDLDDVQLRHLVLREGMLELDVRNMVASPVVGTFDLPGATFADGTSQITATVGPGSPAQPATETRFKDLAGTVMDLRGPQLNTTNTLRMVVSVVLDPTGEGASVTALDSVNSLVRYSGLVPQYAQGYFGSRLVEVEPDTSDLDIFSNIVGGTLDLDHVTLRMNVENGVGVDLQVHLHQLTAINTRTGTQVDLDHAVLQAPINLTRAQDTGNGPLPTFFSTTLDQGNSNVDLFVENLPDRLAYSLDLHINPLGDISNGHDFLYFESELRARLELEVPLRLAADELTLQTYARPDLGSGGGGVQHATLNVYATNGFPFGARLEVDVVDDADAVQRTIEVGGQIATALTDGSGVVTAPTTSQLTAAFPPDALQLVRQGARLRLRAVFNTADQPGHVQLMEHHRLDLQLSIAANYLINGE
ncbi:MAG: hypothetical protein RBT71_13255 [Flavobacteriales bacterium]|jgi:hypothetical protein|nr:hypothetical protein [Flavobacteriales bacterium]